MLTPNRFVNLMCLVDPKKNLNLHVFVGFDDFANFHEFVQFSGFHDLVVFPSFV